MISGKFEGNFINQYSSSEMKKKEFKQHKIGNSNIAKIFILGFNILKINLYQQIFFILHKLTKALIL